jgi:NAD(P)-dependent dehydrogenase (short-subunit alcohol dehydrogenase family)
MGASEYAGLTAVVTGGASGVGLATARLVAACGARVACLGLKPDDVPAPPAGMPAGGADVAVRAAAEESARRRGGIDILVDTAGIAGIGVQGSVEGHTDDAWRRVFEADVFGIVRVSRAALPHLRRSRSAAIVDTCSIAATAGLPDRAGYSSTKGAVLSLTRAIAADLVHPGIRVTCVSPGTADTPWTGRLLDRAADPEADAQHWAPADRWADLSPPTASPAPSRTSRARSTVPPQVLISPSTAACTTYGSDPAPDLPHETVRKENQS